MRVIRVLGIFLFVFLASCVERYYPEDEELIFSSWNKMVESDGKWGLEYRFSNQEGDITWVYGTASAIKDNEGNITGYLGINTDITELKEKEQQLIRQSSLAQMG